MSAPLTKTETRLMETDRTARAIIADEQRKREAKTSKLRELRLKRDAQEPSTPLAKAKPPRRSKLS
jgi:hypothetical protein